MPTIRQFSTLYFYLNFEERLEYFQAYNSMKCTKYENSTTVTIILTTVFFLKIYWYIEIETQISQYNECQQ